MSIMNVKSLVLIALPKLAKPLASFCCELNTLT